MMIKKSVRDALNEQVNMEFHAGYLYLSMGAWFEKKNLKGFAAWMKKQAQEELGHGMKIFNFVYERGGDITLKALAAPKVNWKDPMEAFKDAYGHEQKVSASIDRISALAAKEKDNATVVFLNWYVSEQVEEEAQCVDIIERLKMVGGSAQGLYLLDKELGSR
jgi:ferritin